MFVAEQLVCPGSSREGAALWSFREKGMAYWEKAAVSRVLKSLASGLHKTGLVFSSVACCVPLFHLVMSLGESVSSPVKFELKADRLLQRLQTCMQDA